ncbi:MAG: hypothetical protein IT314_17695 [Anaerolineales bacterium]|nr:hypothetical protein [Anaerolineales bacterium]
MNDSLQPPKSAERVLGFLLTQDNSESILGDFAEMFDERERHSNLHKAQIWYWTQIARSAPHLLRLKAISQFERSLEIMVKNLNSHNKSTLWISLVALIPALLVIVPGIMQSGFGYFGANDALDSMYARTPALKIVVSPLILLGGLFLAFILNAIPAVKLHFERQPEGIISIITFKPVLLHWAVVGLSLLMVGILFIYSLFENGILILGI